MGNFIMDVVASAFDMSNEQLTQESVAKLFGEDKEHEDRVIVRVSDEDSSKTGMEGLEDGEPEETDKIDSNLEGTVAYEDTP